VDYRCCYSEWGHEEGCYDGNDHECQDSDCRGRDTDSYMYYCVNCGEEIHDPDDHMYEEGSEAMHEAIRAAGGEEPEPRKGNNE